jgi:carbon-monoxide dehydrogenase small subunit
MGEPRDGVVPPGAAVPAGEPGPGDADLVTYGLVVDGVPAQVTARWDESLLTVLRERLGVRGPKLGCGHGRCGACTVSLTLDGGTRLACACLTPAAAAAGTEVGTVAALAAADGTLSDVQEAFLAAGAVQCGYCTAGLVQSATALLDRCPEPTRDDVVDALYGTLCRCTGYGRTVDAVLRAAATRRER